MIHKIEIDWNLRSPFMKAVTGEVRIGQINLGCLNPEIPAARIKKEVGSISYRNAPPIVAKCKPLVDIMLRSYFEGMTLQDHSVLWFDGFESRRINDVQNELIVTMKD